MKVYHIKKSRRAYEQFGIEKGDEYYWWKFRNGPMICSKTYPKPSQLTQSSFLGQLYSLQENLDWSSFETRDDLQEARDELVGELESLKDECEGNLSNMPEHLQDSSPAGEILTERIDGLESILGELENVDFDQSTDDIRDELEGIDISI